MTLKSFDIPINVKVSAKTEAEAEAQVLMFMQRSLDTHGNELNVKDFEYFEFVQEDLAKACCC